MLTLLLIFLGAFVGLIVAADVVVVLVLVWIFRRSSGGEDKW